MKNVLAATGIAILWIVEIFLLMTGNVQWIWGVFVLSGLTAVVFVRMRDKRLARLRVEKPDLFPPPAPPSAPSTSDTDSNWYLIGYWITWVLTFFGCYIYCIAEYGFLLGVGLGWLPSAIVATVIGFLWPLIVLVFILIVLYLAKN